MAEKQHEKRYLDLKANIEAGRVFKREQSVTWRCRNCGYLHEGTTPPRCARPVRTLRPILRFWERTGNRRHPTINR